MREAIFAAAAVVVGREGYANATISKITQLAGMAQGTFYLYFQSRQALFDELLPHVGAVMVEFIRGKVHGATDFYAMEERAFRAFFEYLQTNPWFYTVLNQAESAAPKAHRKHFALLTERYLRSLRRSVERGEIRRFRDRELEVIAYTLMAARSYLYLRYVKTVPSARQLPSWVVESYMKIVRGAVR